jgi:hypothetical protein
MSTQTPVLTGPGIQNLPTVLGELSANDADFNNRIAITEAKADAAVGVTSQLGTAALADIGTTPGTVADGSSLATTQTLVAQIQASKAQLGHTAINDANYQVVASDVDVAFTVLTASRVVKLCDVDTYPLGQDLVIGDESGACSSTKTITIVVGDGTSDTIPQQSDGTIVLGYAFASVRLRRGTANIWKIV